MKHLIALALIASLLSCQKDLTSATEQETPSIPDTITDTVESLSFADDVWRFHTWGGGPISTKWTDTSSYLTEAPYINLFIGHSFMENWVYKKTWKDSMAVAPFFALNRAIGGSTFASYDRFLDSCGKYKDKVKNVCITLGVTNEALQAKGEPIDLKPAFYKFMNKVLGIFTTAGINYDLPASTPKLVALGYSEYITSYNQIVKSYFDSIRAVSCNPTRFRVVEVGPALNCTPDAYLPDSVHPNDAAYKTIFVAKWKEALTLNTGTPSN